jgi:hypothetical protein
VASPPGGPRVQAPNFKDCNELIDDPAVLDRGEYWGGHRSWSFSVLFYGAEADLPLICWANRIFGISHHSGIRATRYLSPAPIEIHGGGTVTLI